MELDDRPDLADRLKDAIPAATLIAMRPAPDGGPDEILVVERAQKLAFAGGMIAFPGGRVEAQDHALAAQVLATTPGLDLPPAEGAARIAALRETFEEAGLLCCLTGRASEHDVSTARQELLDGADFNMLLADRGWSIDPHALIPFARWCPPAQISINRRFDTRFYIVRAPENAPISADLTESADAFWSPAAALINDREFGRVKMAGPTRATLMRLAMGHGFVDAKASAERFPVREILPVIRHDGSESWAGVPAGHGYPDLKYRIR